MSPPRLYINQPLTDNASLLIEGSEARYMGRALRLRPGDPIVVFNGEGGQFPAVIEMIDKGNARLLLGSHDNVNVESPLAIHLLHGLCRGERMDLVVQKASELGVRSITPLVTERSVVRLDDRRATKRRDHWRGVAASACEQCGRNLLPEILQPVAMQHWLDGHAANEALRLNFVPGSTKSLKSHGPPGGPVTVLIGPEGGLSDMELELADAHGFQRIVLGPRVLRTETAAIAVISALQTLYGDLA